MPTYEQQADLAAASGADEAERERANYTPYKPTCTCPSGQSGHPHASWCASEWRNDGMEHEMTQAQRCETCGLPVSGPFTTRCFPSCDVPTAAEMDGTGRTQEPVWIDSKAPAGGNGSREKPYQSHSEIYNKEWASDRAELVAARAEIERLKATLGAINGCAHDKKLGCPVCKNMLRTELGRGK